MLTYLLTYRASSCCISKPLRYGLCVTRGSHSLTCHPHTVYCMVFAYGMYSLQNKTFVWSSCAVLVDTCIYNCVYQNVNISGRAFTAAASRIWNSLPDDIFTESLSSLCRQPGNSKHFSFGDCFLTSLCLLMLRHCSGPRVLAV